MKICTSIAPISMDDAITKLHSDSNNYLVEMRIDGIQNLNLKRLLRRPRPEVIVTNRRKNEGGKFDGTASDQFEIFSQAIEYGTEYIDVEFSWGKKFIRQILAHSHNTKVICSYHNFRNTPHNLETTYRKMRQTGSHILKIATTANDINDNKIIFDLLKQSRKDRQKLITLCMGESGEISRILAGKVGCYLTYASLTKKDKTADGQLTYDELKNIYRADKLNSRTKIFGLVGNPVKYSRGFYYHNKRFATQHLNAVYVYFWADDLKNFMNAFQDDISGLSVTMPFKQEIVNYLDKIDDDVNRLNIVNTVVQQKGKLIGYNTDLPAITAVLKKQTTLKKKNVVILGTGATAKTMAFAAIMDSANITIVGRTPSKAKSLADEFKCKWTTIENLSSLDADILMNGTSVGMTGTKKIRLVPLKFFRKGMIVFDAVSDPIMTTLLHDAIERGCRIITGVEFFECQAQLQSKLFIESMK